MGINGSSLDNNVYNLIKKSLDASSLRSKVSANNIANLNTKGYKSYYVSFEDTLKNNMDDNISLKTTDDRHINDVQQEGDITVKQDTTTSMNQDGNNVDVDNEMVNQAANSLMYNAMVTELNNRFSNARYVINGGK
jgi:flagellar basal-body rod protein FlgB